MKLLNKEIKARFKAIGSQENEIDPIVVAKFFDPTGSATWYATEYFPEENNCFGYVTGIYENEWGSFSVQELESIKCQFGLGIERDLYTSEKRISEHVPSLKIELEKQKIKSIDNPQLKF